MSPGRTCISTARRGRTAYSAGLTWSLTLGSTRFSSRCTPPSHARYGCEAPSRTALCRIVITASKDPRIDGLDEPLYSLGYAARFEFASLYVWELLRASPRAGPRCQLSFRGNKSHCNTSPGPILDPAGKPGLEIPMQPLPQSVERDPAKQGRNASRSVRSRPCYHGGSATRPGFEPGKTGPKPVVIPFHHRVRVSAF